MADATLTDVVKKLEEVKSAVKTSKAATEPNTSIFQGISDKLDIFKGMKSEVTPDEASAEAALKVARDVVKKLEEVKSVVTAGDKVTAGASAKSEEAAAEGARTDAKRMGIFQGILDSLNIFKGMKGDDKKAKGFFSSLLGGFKWGGLITSFGSLIISGLGTAFSSIGTLFGPTLIKVLSKLGPIAMIVAGLSMAIKDGITGWMSAGDWGTSKVSGFLGGFFGGAADGGIQNAFANAGKWALIGAGVGSFIPVVGTIAGGLIGAVIGGILGFIGGKKLAEGFDGLGAWFYKQFETLILGPIKAVWDFIAPDWAKSVTDKMQWSDLLPPGLNKLFNGEYFTFDMPSFTWTDLFPKFLVDLFNNVVKVSKKQKWSWMDLLPPFLTKFFTGQYAPGKDEFKWQDLVPEFIWKIAEVAKTAFADTPFTWRSLVPTFILKIIDGFKQTGEFSWMDLVPKFISDLVAAGTAEATKTGVFSWKALLPDWMVGAWDSTRGLTIQAGNFDWRAILPKFISDLFPDSGPLTIAAGLSAIGSFDWRALLPQFIQDLFPSMEGKPLTIAAGLDAIGSWDWKSLLPKFIQDFIADPVKLAGQKAFDWKDLLPPFIRDFFGDKKIDSTVKAVADFDWKTLLPPFIKSIIDGTFTKPGGAFTWKSMLPSFIVSIIDGKPIAEVAETFTWKSLLPQFIKDIIDGTTKIDGKTFTWKSLLPQFIIDIMDGTGQAAEEGSLISMIGKSFSDIAMSIKNRMVAIIDSIADKVPFLTSTAEAARDKLEKMGAFDSVGMGASTVDLVKIQKQLEAGAITQADVAGLLKKEAFDLKTVDIEALAKLAGDAAKGLELKTFEGNIKQLHTGGLIGAGGMAEVAAGEIMIDNQAAAVFLKAAQLLTGSQVLEQSRMGGGGGAPIIVNNNNVDNSVKSNSRQNISVPESTRTNESTLRALQMAA